MVPLPVIIADTRRLRMPELLDTEISWEGPFTFVGRDSSELYKKADRPGLYMWVVETTDGEALINYVGMASRTVAGRLRQHVAAYLAGEYWVYDAEKLRHGDYKTLRLRD